jgi:hypothetical protein
MADELSEGFANALNIIVSTTEQKIKIKKELKQTIFETLITLRNLSVKLKDSRAGKSTAINELKLRDTKMKAELVECRYKMYLKVHGAPSLVLSREPAEQFARDVAPSGDRERKLYLKDLGCRKDLEGYKVTVKSKETNHRSNQEIINPGKVATTHYLYEVVGRFHDPI